MYKKSLALYIDILGFREIVDKTPPEEIYKIINFFAMPFKSLIFDNIAHNTNEKFSLDDYERKRNEILEKKDPFGKIAHITDELEGKRKCQTFSDLVFSTIDLTEIENAEIRITIFAEIERIIEIILLLIKRDILFRGSLEIDEIYHGENIVFGPALVKTYEFESKQAIFPRVCISDKIIKLFKSSENYLDYAKTFSEDFDGIYFIDYLKYVILDWYLYRKEFKQLNEVVEYTLHEILIEHKNMIEYRLEDIENKKFENKLKWLRNYHNRTIRAHGKKFLEFSFDINKYLINT